MSGAATNRLRWAVAAAIAAATASAQGAGPPVEEDVPVAPIAFEAVNGRPYVCVLTTPRATAIVDIDLGRVMSLCPSDGSNVLASAWPPAPNAAETKGSRAWREAGGLWAWPVPEESWERLRSMGLSPEALFEHAGWTGQAWRTQQGAAVCRMTRLHGAPLHLRATRTIRVSPFAAAIQIEERLERTAPSALPAGATIVARIASPVRVILPADSAMESPARDMAFHPPPSFAWSRAPDAAVYRVDLGGEHRFEAAVDGRPWLAAEVPRHLLLLKGLPATPAPRPRAYVHRSATYAELELASPARELASGERAAASVTLELFPFMQGMDARSVAIRARLLTGEQEAAALR